MALAAAVALGAASSPVSARPSGGPKEVRFVYESGLEGNLEPCGCAGVALGGLSRLAGYLRAPGRPRTPTLLLSGGDLLPTTLGVQDRLKGDAVLRVLGTLGPAILGMGEGEIPWGREYLARKAAEHRLAWVGANVFLEGGGGKLLAPEPFQTLQVGAVRLAVLALVAPSTVTQPAGTRVFVADPAAVLREDLPRLREKTDLVVLLAHASLGEVRGWLEGVTAPPDLVFLSHGHPFLNDPARVGPSYLLGAEDRGRFLVDARVVLSKRGGVARVDSKIVPLDDRIPFDDRVEEIVADYRRDVRQVLLTEGPAVIEGPTYIGAGSCGRCHVDAYDAWKHSDHARAFRILEVRDADFDPECIVCHTAGFRAPGGFRNPLDTPALEGVQCESCHGPGSDHAERPGRGFGKTGAKGCLACHTPDQSPDFRFHESWAKIRH